MNKLNKTTAFLLAILFSFIFLPSGAFATPDDTVKLTIIHVNDRHGRTQAEPYISQMAKDLSGENVLILDAGDSLHGQTASILTKGEAMVEVMNAVGYSAMVPGNHDFNFGVDRLTELSEKMNFPLLAANVRGGDGELLFDPYVIFEMNGVKVGVFGIATPETATKSDPRIVADLTFDDPVQTAALMASELKSRGCDIIIALTHLGLSNASEPENRSEALAAVDGIDVVIDGHSHTLLENGMLVGDTLIAQTGELGKNIGVVEIEVSNGKAVSKTAKLVAVPKSGEASELVPDEDIVSKIAEEDAKLSHITEEIVGSTPVFLDGEWPGIRTNETNLADLITDSMKYAAGADIAFLTGGNIRASISAGDITMGQILTTLPYSNLITTVELSGTDVLAMLEYGVSKYPEPAGEYIHVSGIKFEFDTNAPSMRRVTKVTMADGGEFDIDAIYTIATIEFLSEGGDGYTMVANGTNKIYYQGDIEALIEYLNTSPDIKAAPDGRVTPGSFNVSNLTLSVENSCYKGTADIANSLSVTRSACIIMAFYEDGKLVGLKTATENTDPYDENNTAEIEYTPNVQLSSETIVKLMIWDGLETLRPYTEALSKTVNELSASESEDIAA